LGGGGGERDRSHLCLRVFDEEPLGIVVGHRVILKGLPSASHQSSRCSGAREAPNLNLGNVIGCPDCEDFRCFPRSVQKNSGILY